MAVVIGFPKQSRGEASARETGAPAQILFFTGVRYQRMPDSSPGEHNGRSPTRDGGKRRRKRG